MKLKRAFNPKNHDKTGYYFILCWIIVISTFQQFV
jgi:hypothetical protein